MNHGLQIRVYDRQSLVLSEEFEGTVEVGRQEEAGETLYSRRFASGRWRLVVAGKDEAGVSRRQVLIEPVGTGVVRLTNTSTSVPLRVNGGKEIPPKAVDERAVPTVLSFGRRTVEVRPADGQDLQVGRLDEATIAPARFHGPGPKPLPALDRSAGEGGEVDIESLVRWLQAVVVVLQTANRSEDFFETAARAIVEALGMDGGAVLLLRDGRWQPEAHCEPSTASPARYAGNGWRPSQRLLRRLTEEKRTLWSDPETSSADADSTCHTALSSVVAAPILDRGGEVTGALYGERRPGGCMGSGCLHIRKLDAMLLELLASGLSAGLARLELEKAAVVARVQFEQFFTPELAADLAARPDLLKGREVEVTMLFCDIRGFSRVSERIGPAGTVEWVGDVMGAMSDCVIEHHGVLVDYIGDELIAMWGAPKEDPDHARRACLAALEMLGRLPGINDRWMPVLNEPTDVGIGINTGPAQVGNTGSNRKFKYGALGNTVNLASRVQGATRYLKTRLVVTGSTRAALDGGFHARRLGQAAVVNIAHPVELFELAPPGQTGWETLRRNYEEALNHFESQNFREAARTLGNLLGDHHDDGPSLILLARAVNAMVGEATAFDPVWKLPGK